jgi:hypothetical protein
MQPDTIQAKARKLEIRYDLLVVSFALGNLDPEEDDRGFALWP